MSFWNDWAPRKSVAQRRAESARKIQDAARRGTPMSPVVLDGRTIAQTFWGKAWCDNLERYQDYAYRLDRGRSYLRSGSVIDLKIAPGKVLASVSGSSLYKVSIQIDAVKPEAWRAIRRDCAGGIGSRLDLLAGRLSEPVMTRLCADRTGMFPAPSSIQFTCSCPDYAIMCKHVAATMYGVGARLDHTPELLFTLRRVSAQELLASALSELPAKPSSGRVLAASGLAALFDLELAEPASPRLVAPSTKPAARVTKPAVRTTKPAGQTTKPAARSTKAAAWATKARAPATKPAAPATKAAARARITGLTSATKAAVSAVTKQRSPAGKVPGTATRSPSRAPRETARAPKLAPVAALRAALRRRP